MNKMDSKVVGGLILWAIIGYAVYYFYTLPPPTPAELAATAAQKLTGQTEGAAKMGVSLAAYQWGDAARGNPYVICRDKVVENARYGGKKYFLPDYGWIVADYPAHPSLIIQGQDIELTNEYGTKMKVTYTCHADYLKTASTDLTTVNDFTALKDWAGIVGPVVPTH